MNKTKIMYYVFTIGLSAFMLISAYGELFKIASNRELFAILGYPEYLLTILGVAKILGVIGIWQKKIPFTREWAYAGFTIDVSGALVSHLFSHTGLMYYGVALGMLIVVWVSYFTGRKIW